MFRRRRPGWLLSLLLLGAAARAAADVETFDANLQYTSKVVLPLASSDAASVKVLTTAAWSEAARSISSVAADGVSLLILRVRLPIENTAAVRVSLVSDETDADAGSLWSIADQRVVDTTPRGGSIDGVGVIGAQSIVVPSFPADSVQRFAFVLYRSPRNFDSLLGATNPLASRTVRVTAQTATSSDTKTLTVVRPLVVFLHGTSSDNDTWLPFPLWRDSANEVHAFAAGALPFQATRISFNWIWNASGGVEENAVTILFQLVSAIRDWREATGTAATQADVVTHSFGGFVARQAVQTQPDPSPLATKATRNFRAAANWGHGSLHKLVTLAATHRGTGGANASAFLNAKGSVPGFPREAACETGVYIDKGALRDQMVLSEALRALGETRVPGHAMAGSGRAALDPSLTFLKLYTFLPLSDKSTGPYYTASNNSKCPVDGLTNYVFNLDANAPPVTGSDGGGNCSVTPNYDLVVPEASSLGLMPRSATTTAADLSLVGLLNHTAFHDPAFGSPAIVKTVSDRVRFLLEQPTTSASFSYFPAVASVPPTPTEKTFTDTFDPSWLEFGTSCPAPIYDTTCPTYTKLQVIPAELHLEDTNPAPLTVYGLLNGEWVLAYSPTLSSSTSRNCPISLVSQDPSVARISTNEVTGAQTVVAVGTGFTGVTIRMSGADDLSVFAFVSVKGVNPIQGPPAKCVPDGATHCLAGGRFKVQARWTLPDRRNGPGQAIPLTPTTGAFWFFDSDNIELIVKMVDGRSFNSRFWVFAGGLTNVNVTLIVTDMVTGLAKTYVNPLGTAFQPIQDTDAFATPPEPGIEAARKSAASSTVEADSPVVTAPCFADETTLCLNNARFGVRTQWTTTDGLSGFGHAVALSGDTGDFWFFTPDNVEVVVKALNGCGQNSRYWVFGAGLTNINVVTTVTDTQTGVVRAYTNPQGSPFRPIQDTSAFATCP